MIVALGVFIILLSLLTALDAVYNENTGVGSRGVAVILIIAL